MNTSALAVLSLLSAASAFAGTIRVAQEVTDIPEVGPHHRIFTVQKNVNPENVVSVYTKLDEQCRFERDPAQRDEPVFDFYWLMNGTTYKQMNSFFKNEFHNRMSYAGGTANRFQLNANDLKEVQHDLGPQPKLDVVATARQSGCDVQAFINLGPSDNNVRIRLDSIYGEGRAFPPKIYAVTLKGEVIDATGRPTGQRVSRKYNAPTRPF